MKALWMGLALGFATGALWVALGLWGVRVILAHPPAFLRLALQHAPWTLLLAPFALQVLGAGGLLGLGVGAVWMAWGAGGWTAHLTVALGTGGVLALPTIPLLWLFRPVWWLPVIGWVGGILLLGILLPILA